MRTKTIQALGICVFVTACDPDGHQQGEGTTEQPLVAGAPMTVDARLIEMATGKWRLSCLGRFRNLGVGDTATYDAFVTFFEEGAQKALVRGQVTPASPTVSRSSLGNTLTVTHPAVDPSGSLSARMNRAGVDPRRRHSCQVVVHRGGVEVMRGESRPPRPVLKPTAVFTETGQALGNHRTLGVGVGDLDGDGDLDAFQANYYPDANRVWFNNGRAGFTDSGQSLLGPGFGAYGVALGDIDGDGDLDAIEAGRNVIWTNDGAGIFANTGQVQAALGCRSLALGDVDGDGDLDVFTGYTYSKSRVWKNDGSGAFTDSGQLVGGHNTVTIELGDLDGDGDLDSFQGNSGGSATNRILINDGSGTFTENGQVFGVDQTVAIQLGDLDDDGDLDAFLGNYARPNSVLLNNGLGVLTNSGQSLGSLHTLDLALGDLDGDGDLDVYDGNGEYQPSRVWLNDGSGVFTNSGQAFGGSTTWPSAVALADLDGDADLDVFEGNNTFGIRIRRNQN